MANPLEFFSPQSPVEQRLKSLEAIIISMAQELTTLRNLVDPTGEHYREERRKAMLGDHGGPGASPHQNYSWYRFCLAEEDFLRQVLRMTPEQIQKFQDDSSSREMMT